MKAKNEKKDQGSEMRAVEVQRFNMTLSRDELYRIVNATYHSGQHLSNSGCYAVRQRAGDYANVAMRLDVVYRLLLEQHGKDAVFDVTFVKREASNGG
jgi:cell division FtsZ-interacting protein ZapD